MRMLDSEQLREWSADNPECRRNFPEPDSAHCSLLGGIVRRWRKCFRNWPSRKSHRLAVSRCRRNVSANSIRPKTHLRRCSQPNSTTIRGCISSATRMNGTRLMLKRDGVDTQFASIGTIGGLEKLITGQTVGQTIEVFAVAYNDGGDAPASPTRSLVVT